MAHRPATPPTKILLATDLSGRSDRALDGAVELASAWGAELVVVHAFEDDPAVAGAAALPSWRRPPDIPSAVERQIRADIRGLCPRLRFHIEEGSPLKAILEAGRREQATPWLWRWGVAARSAGCRERSMSSSDGFPPPCLS